MKLRGNSFDWVNPSGLELSTCSLQLSGSFGERLLNRGWCNWGRHDDLSNFLLNYHSCLVSFIFDLTISKCLLDLTCITQVVNRDLSDAILVDIFIVATELALAESSLNA